MKNYKEQIPDKCCGNCIFRLYEEHYGQYCTYNIKNPITIKRGSGGKDFSNSVHAFHEWSDNREINLNGICDVWKESSDKPIFHIK